ncbi:aspartate/glutamate racemase family protein [Litoreibacter roseus]|uniref:Aspartate/glutamate racemase family protein n=1 Tax=Litoreibacter roseus TaxID=2601869 RepID=A0A6N6JC44_9RHOB|nr:aspartate/glutamate racemase family protein [Litoreibacter roseus]GFE62948.1 hypothetical protein KIN_00220 [Litoreibacter roseus]
MSRGAIGVLMLETRFPRPPGDIGNPETFDFPMLYQTVRGASPKAVVEDRETGLLTPFVTAGHDLVERGAVALTTSCGFLTLFQKELTAALPVPVATSALLQVPLIDAVLPDGQRAGILTISAQNLTADHLAAVGVPEDTPIGSTEGGIEFTDAILGNRETLDFALAEVDNVEAAQDLCRRHPEVGAICLECTNMPPYAAAIQAATGRPVYSIVTLVEWLHASAQTFRA